MIIKIVTFFLIFMAVLAMFGRLRLRLPWGGRNGGALPRPKVCPECGRYSLRGGPCRACRNGGGGDGSGQA